MREHTFYELIESIYKSTLSFKDPKLEKKYIEQKLGMPIINKILLIFLIILFLLLAIRHIEEFIFMLTINFFLYK